jgi:hypothetical protein
MEQKLRGDIHGSKTVETMKDIGFDENLSEFKHLGQWL